MFVARERELDALERMYHKDSFQMAVIYGRRRVGKTSLIDEFAKDKPTLFFTAQQKTTQQNLELFSAAAYAFLHMPETLPAFGTWHDAISFVAQRAASWEASDPFVFVFDEFPYAATADPSLPSALQIAIDHGFLQTNTKIVLCGSNEGFMETEVLGSKSPLFGRRTMQIRLQPFDYLDAARMLPGASSEELVAYYATFGGTPYYLAQIEPGRGYAANVHDLCFDRLGMLYEEPLMLLREELQEPALYNSTLDAIGSGATTASRIAQQAGINQNSIGRYLRILSDLGIIEKAVPLGGGTSSRDARWHIRDPFFAYWYRFVSRYLGSIEEGAGEIVSRYAIQGQAFDTYVGKQFEKVCLQWTMRQNAAGELPFAALEFGQWWGTDPTAHEQADIDVVATNAIEHELLVGECKWRNSFNESDAIKTLDHRSTLLRGFNRTHLVLFSKRSVSPATQQKASERDDLRLVSASDLYAELESN
ncbi:ATP-binding protein [Olsenella sp. Marseille-P4559]|uniref:ATP-binding protein n=1 Tax=Olsenella sp. Marseille-P4559 TaxID=2364795 RepID=UPI001031D885|nr:ATP-binding protein [Olsenella sp. Marseille-P4559]